MKDCIFCKIIEGQIPSSKVWENENFMAILDVFPNTKGMTLVLPKTHYDSYAFEHDAEFLTEFVTATKSVAHKLEKALGVSRIAMVWEGMGVNHLHAKLYPLHGVDETFEAMEHGTEKVFFDKYPGYITTQLGEQADFEELGQLAEKIRNLD